MTTAASIQRLGLRLISKAGSLPVMAHPALRARVGKVLHRSAHVGGAAQIAVGRAFAARKASRVDPARTSPTTRRGVFDLTPTEDQQMLREATRGLGEDVIRPAAAQADTDRTIPADVTRAAADLGLVLLGVPAELDGIAEDGSAVTGALVLEELARGDMGIAVGIMATASVATALSSTGRPTSSRPTCPTSPARSRSKRPRWRSRSRNRSSMPSARAPPASPAQGASPSTGSRPSSPPRTRLNSSSCPHWSTAHPGSSSSRPTRPASPSRTTRRWGSAQPTPVVSS